MKRVLIAAVFAAVLPQLAAAQVEKQVEVTKAYVPKVESASKLAVRPDMTDTTRLRPEIDYTITPLSLRTTLSTRPIRPATVTYWEFNRPLPFYVKAGAGYPLNSVLDFYASSQNPSTGYVIGYVNHEGQYAKIRNDFGVKNPSTRMFNRIGAAAGKYFGKHILEGDLYYDNRMYHRYGAYAPAGLEQEFGVGDRNDYGDAHVAVRFGDDFQDLGRTNFEIALGGGTTLYYPLREADDFKLNVEDFLSHLNESIDLLVICNPNNPTGYLYTRKEMNRIRDLVKKYDLFLFSDEVYREFIYTGSPYISACHLEGIEQNVVLIDSVSKRYSECGIRIGALITKNRTLRNAVMKFCQARLSPPLIGQIVAEASIDAPRSYSTEVYEEYIERRKCLIDGLNRLPGVYSPIPMGAFYTVARLPVEDSDDFCAWCLSDFDYQGETVMLAPASGFYSDPACGRNEVRIAYVLKKEDLERALVVLGKALEAYNNRK